MKPENTFIHSVHRHVPMDIYRMKNHNAYIAGIFDVWYSGGKADLWIEYKYVPVKKPITPVVPALSKQQTRWFKERLKEGRNVWVIVGMISGGIVYRTLDDVERGLLGPIQTRIELGVLISNFCSTNYHRL